MDDCDALGIISTTALLTPSGPFWVFNTVVMTEGKIRTFKAAR